jgi:hypothetical protein
MSGSEATIYGEATIGGESTSYRIHVDDAADPGTGADTFTIHTAGGYQAGGTLPAGNIQSRE